MKLSVLYTVTGFIKFPMTPQMICRYSPKLFVDLSPDYVSTKKRLSWIPPDLLKCFEVPWEIDLALLIVGMRSKMLVEQLLDVLV